tara:strand:+ start:5550 stop:6011 length:462 start_codon:yes stop_codon:yes gene_type:complete
MKNSNKTITPQVFAVDFDGTCTAFAFPLVGKEIGAAPVLKELVANGHKIILFTMRSDKANPTSDSDEIMTTDLPHNHFLTDAVNWFKSHDIPLYGINHNPGQETWTDSTKPYANYYIDDIALGCPLMNDASKSDRPFVDWIHIRLMLEARNLI